MAFFTDRSASNVNAFPIYVGELFGVQSSRSPVHGTQTYMVPIICGILLWFACADSLAGNLAIRRAINIFMFLFLACEMNVHKRCHHLVPNNCGIDLPKMAKKLAELGISGDKLHRESFKTRSVISSVRVNYILNS